MSAATLKVRLLVKQHDMSVEEAQAIVINELAAQNKDMDFKLALCMDHLDTEQMLTIFGDPTAELSDEKLYKRG